MTTGWENLDTPQERLRWARLYAGFTTMKAAADSLGMQENTYSAYEREPGKSKWTGMDHQRAIEFGRKFKVSWRWLLLREGTPFEAVLSEAQMRAVAAMANAEPEDQERAAEIVETLLRRA